MSDALTIDGVVSGYGEATVLRNVSMRIGAGEVVALLGSNGAGKSTLLKTVAGMLRPRAGRISLDGESLAGKSTEAIALCGVVLVPEGRQLFAGMTVLDNLILGAFNYRRDRSGNRERLGQVYELFPILRERSKQIAGSMSGGQQQMVAIGRGLMARPRVLLLDEPSLGLAPVLVKQIFDAIGELNRREKLTVFLVEQNAFHALKLAHRGYVMVNGLITLEGGGKELLRRPEVRAAYLEGGRSPHKARSPPARKRSRST